MDFTADDLRLRVFPVEEALRSALEAGVSGAPKVREVLDLPPDPWLDPHLVRRVARAHLERDAEETACVWSIDPTVPNSGIHIRVPGAHIRVRRGRAECVPGPGHSRRSRRFYTQGRRLEAYIQGVLDFGGEGPATGLSLIDELRLLVLWNNDDEDVHLWVAVPAGTWDYGADPKLVACVPLDFEPGGEFMADDDGGHDLIARFDDEEGDANEGEAK